MPIIEHYGKETDSEYCDRGGADSLAALLRQAEAALTRLAVMDADALV
jgi:hypothetical protein